MPLGRRRRRPIARAAVIGGVAAHAGKKHAESQYREQEQEARLQELEAEQYQPVQQPAEDPTIAKIKELAQLHAQGILNDEEFAAAKAKLLN